MGEGRSTGGPGRRRKSIRLRDSDYAAPGAYFVTIVAHGRQCLFGGVTQGNVLLSQFEKVVAEEWFRSAKLRWNVELHADEFVVMPNHVHGIVRIVDLAGARHHSVGATGRSPLREIDQRPGGPAPGSLGAMVAGFKAAVTARVNAMRGTAGRPVWQRNYHERVTRTDTSLARIRSYIMDNPKLWHLDRENPAGGGSTL